MQLLIVVWFLGEGDGPDVERSRLVDVDEQQHQSNEGRFDHLRSLYSQHLMSAASAAAYGVVGLLMGFVNKVCHFLPFEHLRAILIICITFPWPETRFFRV